MKKIATILIVLMCILSFSVAADSDDSEFLGQEPLLNHVTYENIVALYEHWETNGYPDYVGFVYSTDGSENNLTVLLVGDDGTLENQIRSMLISDSGVSFGSAKYSYNELLAIADEISSDYLEKNKHFYGLGVGILGNAKHLIVISFICHMSAFSHKTLVTAATHAVFSG